MIRSFTRLFWRLALIAACMALAGRINLALLAFRTEARMTSAPPLINAPPLMVFTTVALGGFRGILADALWLRVAALQEEGRYFEIAQLSDWIAKLEPHVDAAWTYHAWNMAYNISYLFQTPEDKWRWVQNGIKLLRDEGLVYNPNSPYIYRELGYIYQFKIGNIFDKAHWYYKFQLALEMESLMPGGAAAADRHGRFAAAAAPESNLVAKIDQIYGP